MVNRCFDFFTSKISLSLGSFFIWLLGSVFVRELVTAELGRKSLTPSQKYSGTIGELLSGLVLRKLA